MESDRYQAVGSYNLRRLAVGGWMNRDGILDWIQITLRLDRATDFLVIFDGDSFDPDHISSVLEVLLTKHQKQISRELEIKLIDIMLVENERSAKSHFVIRDLDLS